MMIQNKAYKTATLSLVLLMSGQAIKADNEIVPVSTETAKVSVSTPVVQEEVKQAEIKSADKATASEEAPVADKIVTKEEPKAAEKKEEKKVVKGKATRLRDNKAVSAFIPTPWKRFKQWARIESKSNNANAANDVYATIEDYFRPSETDNEIQRTVKTIIFSHIEAIKEAKDKEDFVQMEKEIAIIDGFVLMVSDLQDTVSCLSPIAKTEKDLQEALRKAEQPIVAPILKFKEFWNESGKKIEDILNKHASSEVSNLQEFIAELAVVQKELTGLYEQDLANPINEKRIAKSKIQTLKDYLGYVAEKIAPENDLAKVGAPENNTNLAATLPASDVKASKEAKEVKAEETKNTEVSEAK